MFIIIIVDIIIYTSQWYVFTNALKKRKINPVNIVIAKLYGDVCKTCSYLMDNMILLPTRQTTNHIYCNYNSANQVETEL